MTQGAGQLTKLRSEINPGEVVLLGSRPNMGKTALALSIVEDVARENQVSCLYISLEIEAELLKKRFEKMVDDDAQMAPIYFEHLQDCLVGSIVALCRQYADKGIKVIVLDYMQLVRGCDSDQDSVGVMGERKLMQMMDCVAKQMQCTVYVLSQVEQSAEERADKRPTVEDIKAYGSIREFVMRTMLLYRESYYSKVDGKISPAEIITPKKDGRSDTTYLSFDSSGVRFF